LILTNRYQGFDPRKNVPRASWSSWDEMQKPLFLTPNVVSFWIIFTPYHFGTHKKSLVAYTYQFLDRLGHLGTLWLPKPFLQKSDKGQVFIDQVRPALGSVGWLSLCSKSLKIALFQTFSS